MKHSSQDILSSLEVSQQYADKYTYAVFAAISQNESELLGSSVIVEYKSRAYFVTAGHLIRRVKKAKHGIMLSTENGLVSLSGRWVMTEGEDDNLDIAVIQLGDNFVKENSLNLVKAEMVLP